MFNAQDIILARQFKPDLSISKLDTESLILLKIMNNARGGGVVPVYDADIANGIASFSGVTKSKPLVSLLLNLPISQQGSGTPSPDNIRDFIGVSQAVIGQTSGYGEYFRGLLNGTYGFVDLGDLEWNIIGGIFRSIVPSIAEAIVPPLDNRQRGAVCSGYPVDPQYVAQYTMRTDKTWLRVGYNIDIKDTDYSSLEDFISGVSGIYLIYELATPSTPITPEQFATLCQAFGITGNTYTISFGQTVYSAILDVLTGKLYLTHEIKTIDENRGVTRATTNVFYLPDFFDAENDTESINCNVYERGENKSTGGGVVSNPDYSFCCRTTSNQLYIKDVRFNTIADYNDYLANNPVKIAVKLAEPIEVQLTPTVINTLIGDNVIFADVANVTECKFTRK